MSWETTRWVHFTGRLHERERDMWVEAAALRGMTKNGWMREAIRERAELDKLLHGREAEHVESEG
jgi:uncharacterized protein (DUF1778 family)